MTYPNRKARRSERTCASRSPPDRKKCRSPSIAGSITATTPVNDGISGNGSVPHLTPVVTGLADQRARKWVEVSRLGATAIGLLTDLNREPGRFYDQLAEQGVVITVAATKSYIASKVQACEWPQSIYVASQPGYHCGAYVLPSGEVIGTPDIEHFKVALDNPMPLASAGTWSGWLDIVQTFVVGQPILIFMSALALAGPVIAMQPTWANILVELVSRSSTGKTTVLLFAAAFWGAPAEGDGSLTSELRTTVAGLEEDMIARSGSFYPLDEVNQLGSVENQAQLLPDAIFMFDHGVTKKRKNEKNVPRAPLSAAFTSNIPLPVLMSAQSRSRAIAAGVRIASVSADAGAGYGILHRLPVGFANSEAAVRGLELAITDHCGHAARRFIKELVQAKRESPDELAARIRRSEERFLRDCRVDRNDGIRVRSARSYAQLYAVGALASRWGLLPDVDVLSAMLTVYRANLSNKSPQAQKAVKTAAQRVSDYVTSHQSQFVDLDRRGPRTQTLAQLDTHPGFLMTTKGRRCLVMRRVQWEAVFGGEANRMLSSLKQQDRLVYTEGFQTQLRISADKPNTRVYAIIIDD